jgi:tetratricopeptide (TPR) repeat protein
MTPVDQDLRCAQELQLAGRYVEAEALCRQLLEQAPQRADVHFLVGCLCVQTGRPADGVPHLAEAARLLPQYADGHIVLGNAQMSLGHWSEAADALSCGVALRPDLIPARSNLALALHLTGRHAEAVTTCMEVLAADPNSREALTTLGQSLCMLDRPAEAEEAWLRALAIDPNLPHVYGHLARMYEDQERYAEAEQAARSALRLSPDDPAMLDALARALMELQRLDEARACLQHAMRIDEGSAEILFDMARASARSGALEEAVGYGVKAAELDPDPKIRWQLAQDQLRTGRYHEAWKNVRYVCERVGGIEPQHEWDGSPLDGRTLVVYAIGGLGDTLQFARFLPMVAERAQGTVIFECQPTLVELLSGVPGPTSIVPQHDDRHPADCYISLMSVPTIFDTTDETIPPSALPVRIPEEAMAVWQRHLAGASGYKVGLCWSCRPKTLDSQYRSVPLEKFAPLSDVEGLRLVSLQIGPPADQIAAGSHGLDILHAPEDLSPMTKVAALIRQLDLVISIDTSISHLAGVMGVETWLPIHFVPSLYWNFNRQNGTPWYPRHRQFRQPRFNDWDAVIERIRAELVSRIGHKQEGTLRFLP